MRRFITLFAVLGMVLALAPAAQAELVITVDENIDGNIYFAWNGTIGASGTATAPAVNGSADNIKPLDGTLSVGDRSTNDLNPDSNPPYGNKKWTPSGVYAGITSPFGTYAGTSTFIVTGNIPFFVKTANAGLFVGYTDQANTTGIPDLSSTVFTGSFSLPGTLASLGFFDTVPTALPCTVWTASSETGSIVFKALAPEIDVSGNSVSIPDGDTTPSTGDDTDFGSTTAGGSTIVKTYTVENTGTALLTLTDPATVSGAGAGQFAVGALTDTTLNNGETATFTVTYTPSAGAAVHNATVSLVNDDSDENPYDFAITAETTAAPEPEINITGNSVSIPDGDTTPGTGDHTDFGSTNVAGSTIVRTYTVENTGTALLTLTDPATVTGAGAAQFAVGTLTDTTLNNGETATFTVTYSPSAAAAVHNATVSLVNDDSDENPYNFAITAETTPALVIYVTESGGNVNFTWNGIIGASGTPTSNAGGGSADQIVPLTGNFQVADRDRTDVPSSFSPSEEYAGTTYAYGSGGSLPGGESDFLVSSDISFSVHSAPRLRVGSITDGDTDFPDLATDVFTGSFSLPGDFSTYGLFDTAGTSLTLNETVPLWTATTGDGAIVFAAGTPGPEIDVTGNSVSIPDGDTTPSLTDDTDLGSTTVGGSTIVKTYTVTNSGGALLTLTDPATVSGAGAVQFAVGTLTDTTLNNGETATFTVTYTPSAGAAVHNATVSLVNDDSDENPYDFAITAETEAANPEIDVTGNSVSIPDGDTTPSTGDHTDFGSTNVGGSDIVRTYTVENTGDALLTLTDPATVSGAGAAQFAVGTLTDTTLNNGETATFTVTYSPSGAAAVHNATVSLASDDADEGTYTFAIRAETTPSTVQLDGGTTGNVDENEAIGTVVGPLTTINTDGWGAITYDFAGGTHDALFSIDGTDLETAAVFDKETQDTYSIKVKATDGSNATTNTFTITIDDVSEPVDRMFANAEVQSTTTLAATLEAMAGGVTYGITAGEHHAALFEIQNTDELHLKTAPGAGQVGDAFFVEVTASGGVTDSMLIKVTVVSGTPAGTVFKVR